MSDDPTDLGAWRAGDSGSMSGQELLEAVRQGKLWINVREAMNLDPVYKPLFDALFSQMRYLNPGFNPLRTYGGILISSPTAQCLYHADVSETVLLHVKGVKRFRIYPPRAPYLENESMESILIKDQTEDLPFKTDWDEHAATIDLEPGDFVSWPLNAPHRVENLCGLNVSVTCEIVTRESMLSNGVHYTNGKLRRMGRVPQSFVTTGPQAYAKLAMSKAFKLIEKLTGASKRPMPKSETTFDVDLESQGGVRDRQPA